MSPEYPEEYWLLGLTSLPGAGPSRLCALLALDSAQEVWRRIGKGERQVVEVAGSRERAAQWQALVQTLDLSAAWERYAQAGLGVVGQNSCAFPEVLRTDHQPPAVLFVDGDLSHVHPLAVAVVGTRRCTRYGTDIAFELGGMLSQAGITVVSGLALGIDAAAHAGALEAGGAPPVAVVANDLSTPYPRQNSALWRAVASKGAILSEAPLGSELKRWRFPSRNRLVAALSLVTVVVESEEKGGSLYTANEAVRRDRPVLAVPGPIHSPSSQGTNRLIADGHHPVCELVDVLLALGLVSGVTAKDLPAIAEADQKLLDAFCWQPVTIDTLLQRTDCSLGDLASQLHDLELRGLVSARGRWYERRFSP